MRRHLMKIEITKEWCMRKAHLDNGESITAGLLREDSSLEHETKEAKQSLQSDDSNVIFGKLVRLMRRNKRLTVEKLASEADIDLVELVEIEDDARHKPDIRAVYQLANYFNIPVNSLTQLAGLTTPKDSSLFDEAIRFAARSEPTEKLSKEERAALEAFVVVLCGQKQRI